MKEPRTLQEAIVYFSDADNCLKYMAQRRWPEGVSCPTCGRTDVSFLANQRKWQCKSAHAKRQFTAKIGTIFEDSPLGLEKWLPAVWIITTAKNGVSSYELSRSLGVTQKTAWFMLHRIREALRSGSLMKIGNDGGPVEIDETYIGPNTRKMHAGKRLKLQNTRPTKDNPLNDADRFEFAMTQIAGLRLTYAELTGKVGETPQA
jgi:transposase-like protein